jgi:hypothetical protein
MNATVKYVTGNTTAHLCCSTVVKASLPLLATTTADPHVSGIRRVSFPIDDGIRHEQDAQRPLPLVGNWLRIMLARHRHFVPACA